jgi:hypothetical protein
MSQTISPKIVDLGLQVVNEEIDHALAVYPDESGKKVFANLDFRQKLIDYVMGAIPETYFRSKDSLNRAVTIRFPSNSLELRLRIEKYVHWGIEYILATHSDVQNQNLTPKPQLRNTSPDYAKCHN